MGMENSQQLVTNKEIFDEVLRLLRIELQKHGKDLIVDIREEGLLISKPSLIDPNVPVENAIISEEEMQFVMDCLHYVQKNVRDRIVSEKE
jgi:hypothetical protein